MDRDLPGAGVRLRGTRWPGRGVPVLLLHGLASQRRFWNLVVPGIAGLPVAALDQRGHGESEQPAGPYGVDACADDLAPVLDALGWDRAVVVGHSWGARVALAFAARHPERTLAVVAVDGGLGGVAALEPLVGSRAAVREMLAPPRWRPRAAELPRLLARGPLAPWWTPAHAEALLPGFEVDADGLARARLGFDLHMKVLDGMLDHDAEASAAAARCAVWAVFCEPGPARGGPGQQAGGPQDEGEVWRRAREAGWERAGRVLARPRLLRWIGAEHDVPLQWPALVAGLVRAAVDDVSAGAGERRGEGGRG
jgi:pimeloyl-ACP methyl ester carboxylesterase